MIDSMDRSQESEALSTESSNQLPPIPNSSPPIASPLSPSNPVPQSKTIDRRHILKPVAPSKRPELADIIATRQRRERAWHARLMICTTAISNIESTLVKFKNDIEKEEVEAFKAYLRLAIANFAAVDTSPTPPKVPTHSRPTKWSSYGSGKDKNVVKKVAIATPRIMMSAASTGGKIQEAHILPKKPQISQNT
ncbi:hypothetical protein EPUL_003797 [Erysiphe pulchra]|uniref:Uncharacterized protein n=1 Tax=Erysiphe pulchra TaxID=225359 RepID=A0A2S4PX66_9PEZI|nr:hypothetical protein EPUL_003797 [Erysiphe pulchra]